MIRTFYPSTIREPASGGLNMLDYNPAVWLDAQDAGSVILTDGKVSQWSDLSGNNNHAVQTDAAMRPLYGNNSVSNGLASIDVVAESGLELSISIGISEVIMVTSYKDGVDSTFDDFTYFISGNGSFGTPRILGDIGTSNLRIQDLSPQVFKNNSETSQNNILPLPLTVCNFRFDLRTERWGLMYFRENATRSLRGRTSEIVLFANQLAASDRTDIVNNLMTKWAIS